MDYKYLIYSIWNPNFLNIYWREQMSKRDKFAMQDDEDASSLDESAQEDIGTHMGGKKVNADAENPGKKEDKQSNTIMQ